MTSRADALFARYVERLVVEGERLSVDELAAGDEDLRASLLRRLESFRAVEEALGRPPRPLEGATIGPYRLLARLGAGGMGDVYRARDQRLGRDVALKLLPPLFALDPRRRARFEREARLLAAVSHPNVESIYGIETSAERPCLVLELVAGETLAERLKHGPLRVRPALRLLAEVAAGLEAAHAKGIVHRDLKPANVQITPDGHAKVLDFSLGKQCGPEGFAGAPPTVTRRAPTITGMILGTASYMSPEQARGRDLDERTDVWSFGCVLYEALSGRRAFPGDTFTDAVTRVFHHEPDWRALPREAPPAIRRLIRHCLEKEPGQRLGSIGAARDAIADALDGSPPFARRGFLATAVVALTVALALGALLPRRRGNGALPPAPVAPARASPAPTPSPPPSLDPDAYRSYLAVAYSRWRETLGRGAAGPEASLAYVTFGDPPALEIVSLLSNRMVARVALRGRTPSDFVNIPSLTPDGTRLYLTVGVEGDRVLVVDTRSRTLMAVPDGDGIRVETGPGLVALTRDGARGYVSHASGRLALIDTDPGSVTYHLRLPFPEERALRLPNRIACILSPDSTRLYVWSYEDDTLSVIDADPRSATYHRRLSVPGGRAIPIGPRPGMPSFKPDGTRLYFPVGPSDEVRILDTDPGSPTYHRVLATVAAPALPVRVVVTPDGSRAYVVASDSTTVLTLDTASGARVFEPIEVGVTPGAIAFTPDGARALVVNRSSRTISVIDTDPRSPSFHRVVATIPMRGRPAGLVVGPAPPEGGAGREGGG
jgi:YVTN family beta-propeller protein